MENKFVVIGIMALLLLAGCFSPEGGEGVNTTNSSNINGDVINNSGTNGTIELLIGTTSVLYPIDSDVTVNLVNHYQTEVNMSEVDVTLIEEVDGVWVEVSNIKSSNNIIQIDESIQVNLGAINDCNTNCKLRFNYDDKSYYSNEFSIEMPEVDLCDGLEGELKDYCEAERDQDVSLCNDNLECIVDYAKNVDDTVCDNFEDHSYVYYCKSVVEGKTLCQDSEYSRVSDKCYYLYALKTDNLNNCNKITDKTESELLCYTHFAVKSSDKDICESIVLSVDQDDCYLDYTSATGDITACEELWVGKWEYNCYRNTAVKFGRLNYCNDLGGSRSDCYSDVIALSDELDLEYCFDAFSKAWEHQCIQAVAVRMSDSSICDDIDDNSLKQSCKDKFIG